MVSQDLFFSGMRRCDVCTPIYKNLMMFVVEGSTILFTCTEELPDLDMLCKYVK